MDGTELLSIVAHVTLAAVIIDWLWKVIYPLFPYVLTNMQIVPDLRKLCGGKWAVVTGATDGIGKSYAKELARQGFNILLISRSPNKLQLTAEEIQKDYDVKVKMVGFDYRETDVEAYKTLEAIVSTLEVGILINNVGMTAGRLDTFHRIHADTVRDVLIVNCLSLTLMTRMVIPQMLSRGKGIVINVSSGTALVPSPLVALYSSTKAFMRHFTESLVADYSESDLIFQCAFPLLVSTKMSGIRKSSLFIPDPDKYARSALRTIGLQSKTMGYLPHALQLVVLRFLPSCVVQKYIANLLRAVQRKWSRKRNKGL